jgi:putative oxidoreductase
MPLSFLRPYSEYIYSAFRIVFGFGFMLHGAQKLFGFFGNPVTLSSRLGAAGVIEFFGGLLIMLGLFTTVVAFIASGEMASAFFIAHFPNGWHPLQNRGEAAMLYCFAFLYIASRGPGVASLDRLLRGRPAAG